MFELVGIDKILARLFAAAGSLIIGKLYQSSPQVLPHLHLIHTHILTN
jgi:hypothetical protein